MLLFVFVVYRSGLDMKMFAKRSPITQSQIDNLFIQDLVNSALGKKMLVICSALNISEAIIKSSCREVFFGKGVLKKCSIFTGELAKQLYCKVNLQSNFIEIALRQWVFCCKFAAYFRTLFYKNASGLAVSEGNSLNPALREKYPNTEFFLVRIFPHLD